MMKKSDLERDPIKLRELKEEDLELLMAWRSHPKLYKWFYKQDEALTWAEHYSWWKERKNRKDWIILYKGKYRKRAVGSANISKIDSDYPEIGILIGEVSLWGEGVGTATVKILLEYLKEKGYNGATAKIMRKNESSVKLFEQLGFKKKQMISEREVLYKKKFHK